MEEEQKYEEYVKENYDELVKDYCQENSTDFEAYCMGEQHIVEEYAENNSDFEEYCKERFEN